MWPFREKREESSPTSDAVIAAILATQGGFVPSGATAALETASGLYARALSLATVSPDTPSTRLLTPSTRAQMARGMIQSGESMHVLYDDGEGVALVQVNTWDALGRSPVPTRWRYRVDIPTPTRTISRTVSAMDAVHCRYATKPAFPWRGQSPLHFAPTTRELAQRIEQALCKEMSVPTGLVVFTSGGEPMLEWSPEDTAAGYSAMRERIAQGGTMLGASRRAGEGEDEVDPFTLPNQSPVSERLGPRPPAEMPQLRAEVADSILGACGVPPAMIRATSAGAAREALRQWLHTGIAHIGALMAEELRTKLATPTLEFDFEKLYASDITGRARAFGTMVTGGMDIASARRLAGLGDA